MIKSDVPHESECIEKYRKNQCVLVELFVHWYNLKLNVKKKLTLIKFLKHSHDWPVTVSIYHRVEHHYELIRLFVVVRRPVAADHLQTHHLIDWRHHDLELMMKLENFYLLFYLLIKYMNKMVVIVIDRISLIAAVHDFIFEFNKFKLNET